MLTCAKGGTIVEKLSKQLKPNLSFFPEKVIQFGSGNFMRGFLNWQLQQMNNQHLFNGSAVLVKPTKHVSNPTLEEQDYLYTVVLEGFYQGQMVQTSEIITTANRLINPYEEWETYLQLAEQEELAFIISNTTEAGIQFDERDCSIDQPSTSFPGKLTALLFKRFQLKKPGFTIIPCELIDRNGDQLKEIVLQYASLWNLEEEFISWIHAENIFCCSLVDRIVPGYPRDTANLLNEEHGYIDNLMVKAEPYLLWVIEGPQELKESFPLEKAGLNVLVTDDMTPYRERKVHLLNGPHTAMVPLGLLAGLETVEDVMNDADFAVFINQLMQQEIMPLLPLPLDDLKAYAKSIIERFKNPFIRHELSSIALNSVSKYKARLLPLLIKYQEKQQQLPPYMTASLAALFLTYRGTQYKPKDSDEVLEAFSNAWENPETIAFTILNDKNLWDTDLTTIPNLAEEVTAYIHMLRKDGARAVLQKLNNEKRPPSLLKLNERDNVAVALRPINAAETVYLDGISITAKADIPQGHKIALTDIQKSSNVIKYGYPIGHTLTEITRGDWLHTHNVKTNLDGELEYTYEQDIHQVKYPKKDLTFQGYRRANGKVGIRNDLYIVPTVGCVNGTAEYMLKEFEALHPDLGTFDNITILKHPYGCSQLGEDHENTRSILIDAVSHPNAGGVLVFGLGCENNVVAEFRELLGDYDGKRVKFLVAQEVGNEIEAGLELLEEIYEAAKNDQREPIPIAELNVGLKCGGSDGFSGITANPLLGAFSDFLISQGGSTILTEVPEMFGAEQMLMARAENEKVFEDIVHLINDFKHYFHSYGEPVYENPSPGNKAGGITTLEDKSLGCTQKAGTAPVVDVLQYGEKISKKGLSLLQAPGNDLVASSALAAADCHLVLFTTGRGTPFGSFVPTVKVATNSTIYEHKRHWMDFNAGPLLERPMNEVLEEFIEKVIAVASGEKTRNEANSVREIAIFKTGVTL